MLLGVFRTFADLETQQGSLPMLQTVQRELSIPNDTKYLATVREAIFDLIARSDFPGDDVNHIVLAVDEAVANIIEHAYQDQPDGEMEIDLSLHADAEKFEVIVADAGRRFDPYRVDTPNMEEHVRLGKKSGLGIFLMRKIMDQVSYRFCGNGANELQMIKFAKPSS